MKLPVSVASSTSAAPLLHRHVLTSTVFVAVILLGSGLCNAEVSTSSASVAPQQRLLVVSFDAFKPEYLRLNMTPHLQRLIDGAGSVHSRFMRPTFPTKTFPNHFTLATGLHAGWHGVLGSTVFDRKANRSMGYGWELFHQREEVLPIWTANELQGGRSGSMMWPGGEFAYGKHNITYTTAYRHGVDAKEKIRTCMQWLLSADLPANLVMLYFDQPDFEGHIYSPDSPQTHRMIRTTDDTVAYIQSQLAEHQLLATTNVIYVSDHGMSSVASPHFVNISALLPPNSFDAYGGSPVLQIVPRRAAETDAIVARLRNASAQLAAAQTRSAPGAALPFQVYKVADLPERWHLPAANERLGPLVAVAAEGWAFEDMATVAEFYERTYNVTRSPQRRYGIHGFDNADEAMRATFVAAGPAMAAYAGGELPGFANVELFGLMWRLLGWRTDGMPATNGTVDGAEMWERVLGAGGAESGGGGDGGEAARMETILVQRVETTLLHTTHTRTWQDFGCEFVFVLFVALSLGLLVHLMRIAARAQRMQKAGGRLDDKTLLI